MARIKEIHEEEERLLRSYDKWIDGLNKVVDEYSLEERCLDTEDMIISIVTDLPVDEVIPRRISVIQQLDYFLAETVDGRFYIYYSQFYPRTVLEYDDLEMVWIVYIVPRGKEPLQIVEYRSIEELKDAVKRGSIHFL